MATFTIPAPQWYRLSHQGRYRKLNQVRRVWCRRNYRPRADSGRTVHLDGRWISDVPSFYLSLGEAINGPWGYFGGSIDALDDCLCCGGFGVSPPLTVRLSHFEEVRNALDGAAWCRFHAEHYQKIVEESESIETLVDNGYLGDGSPADIANWTATYTAALADQPFDSSEYDSYFNALVEIFEKNESQLIPAYADGRQNLNPEADPFIGSALL